ncbi:E3 SUMO-protein ligase RanBP2-like [Uloborus diversus]|uniref:E3 SUMO-protein ligase RanBP2-like n=1 Tax=Uloborus diversus TaxID=327109 RepID=UPI00240970A3|nr:E3 SUMO-protein ligase RanBP2-like [Uloborus diversus]
MFKSKKDVERHVSDVLSKIDNENEKNLRGYTFARLYFQVKDYDNARKYLTGFLSVRDHHAASHKLMAQIYEATNDLENALQSYKRSLEIDPHQNDIVLKICELYCQHSVDHETARYWADRAEQLFPHNATVFKLRECLVSAEGEPDRQELENLIATELAAQPKNVNLRIKLLRLYLDTERVKEAYDHATLIEGKKLFMYSKDWYYLLGDLFEAYQEEFTQELDCQFYMNYVTALDRLIFLTLVEPHAVTFEDGWKSSSVDDTAAALLTFDQLLKKASEIDSKDGSWNYFVNHMKGQLYFYMTSLLLKRAKQDQGNCKEAIRLSGGLALVCYTFKPVNLLQEIWFSQMEDNQKLFTTFFQQATLRTSNIAHVIMNMCKEDKSSWLQKNKKEVCISQVKERIYSRIFSSVVQKEKVLSSCFILDSTFERCSLEFPSESALKEYDKSVYKLCPSSLHHLVWLELNKRDNKDDIEDSLSEVFKNLQYGNKNLSKGSCESLCVLDLEAFLCASILQARYLLAEKKGLLSSRTQELQFLYPPDIADSLCSKQQMAWWKSAYGLNACLIKEKLGEHRLKLQQGLEVIRGIGNHGMDVRLVIHLAQVFSKKADMLTKTLDKVGSKLKSNIVPEKVDALHVRAVHYWNIALGILDKLATGQNPRVSKDPMFVIGSEKMLLSNHEIKAFQEEGLLFLAVRFMDTDKLDEAAKILSKLSSPYGSFYLALTMKKLASLESKNPSARIAYLSKAKSSLHETMDRTKDDRNHPLNNEIHIVLEEVENELSHDLQRSHENDYEEADEVDSYSESQSSFYITPNEKLSSSSTPRLAAKFLNNRSKLLDSSFDTPRHFEPSPERLDAQIRALTLNQDSIVKSFNQQQQVLIETNKAVVESLKQNTDVLEQLKKVLEELSLGSLKQQAKPVHKKSYMKGQGDAEDYDYEYFYPEEPEEFQASGYNYDHASRIVHDPTGATAPLNYVVPTAALPPGPPPALNHYNYQYPPHAVLPPPSAPTVAERSSYYHSHGQGLPFSEGQQLPQFHFHVASSVVKPPPPVMSNIASVPPPVSAVPLPPVSLPPPQTVIPPAGVSLPVHSPWTKTVSAPHAFQIPLPTGIPFASVSNVVSAVSTPSTLVKTTTVATVTTDSKLKNLLQSPPSVSLPLGTTLSSTPTSHFANGSSSIFSGLVKTPENSNLERSRCDSEVTESPDVDVEREVMGDFKPLIPLPEEIVVETGEENEVVMFEDRAKLYRFVDQEWKERGVGTVKILHHEGSGRVRLLMRRDQVLKVCANHYITADMEINSLKNSDKAWTWLAQDFADEELKPEHFCIRFKTSELAATFKFAFEKAVNLAKEVENQKTPKTSTVTNVVTSSNSHIGFGSKFLPKAGSWTCPTCYVSNNADKLLCAACETKKPGSEIIPVSSSAAVSTISTVSNSWETTPSKTEFSFGGVQLSCDNSQTVTKPIAVSTNASMSILGGFTFTTHTPKVLVPEVDDSNPKDREILVVSTKSKNGPEVTKINASKSSPFTGFTFKSPVITTTATSSQFTPFSFTSLSTVTTPSQINTTPTTSVSEISKMQNLVQNIVPETGFDSKSTVQTSSILKKPSESKNAATGSPLTVQLTSEGRRVSFDGAVETAPEDFIPTAEFKPVVPLPALVDVKTGEEEDEKLFSERAKLYRFDSETKEWKERGIGEIKILYLKDNKKYRILMRREQVLKICANHYILPDIKLTPLSNSDRSWTWFAQDFSDGDLKKEKFAAKFKSADIATEFYNVFTRCQSELQTATENKQEMQSDLCKGNKAAFDDLFKPVQNSWECSKCCKSNMNLSSCVYCKTPKPISSSMEAKQITEQQQSLSEMFKPEIGSWECKACYVRNKSSNKKCECCELPRVEPTVSQTGLKASFSTTQTQQEQKPLSELFKPETGSWECKMCYVRNKSSDEKCLSCEFPKPASATTKVNDSANTFQGSGADKTFQPNVSTTTTSSSSVSNSAFAFQMPKTNSQFVFGMKPTAPSSTFSFGLSTVSSKEDQTFGFKPTLTTSNAPTIFGGVAPKTDSQSKTSIPLPVVTAAPTYVFGNSNSVQSSPFSFGSETQQSDSGPVEFRFGSPQKYEFNFSGVRPRSPVKTPKSPRSPATPSDIDEDETELSDADIYFQPAIPLPPKVDVKTGEEDEKVLFCQRAKLFRFSAKEWKERGIGDLKILFDHLNNKVRLLMRRDQVLKVCLNHYLTKDLEFEWRGEKSLTWAATDFSESEPSPELFAARFKTTEIAELFKQNIDAALGLISEKGQLSKEAVNRIASSFSFKDDSPVKAESEFNSGMLSARFNSSASENQGLANASAASGPVFSFSKDKSPSRSFFSTNFETNNEQTIFSGSGFQFGTQDKENDDDEIEIIYQASPPADKVALARKFKLPDTFFLYENKADCPGCIGCDDSTSQSKASPDKKQSSSETAAVSIPEKIDSVPVSSESEDPMFKLSKNVVSFADLALTSTDNALSSSSSKMNAFEGAGTPLFSNLNTSTEADGDDDTVAQGPDIHFEPVIPLPELITVKTGEEDETPVFVNRAKLFKFDSSLKQWKERGIGDLKILKHNENLKYRIILRRDQVHKIACNHFITPGMELSPMSTSETAVCWNAIDYSDNQPDPSKFAARFKNKELLEKFKATFHDCVSNLSTVSQSVDEVKNPTDAPVLNQVNDSHGESEQQDPIETSEKSENVNAESESNADANSDDSEEYDIVFEKRVTFEVYDEKSKQFKVLGPGTLQILYDDTIFGYKILMTDYKDVILGEHVIAIQTCLRTEKNKGIWAAIDLSLDPPKKRQFRASFSSNESLQEFKKYFQEGKEMAVSSEIVEKTDIFLSGATA